MKDAEARRLATSAEERLAAHWNWMQAAKFRLDVHCDRLDILDEQADDAEFAFSLHAACIDALCARVEALEAQAAPEPVELAGPDPADPEQVLEAAIQLREPVAFIYEKLVAGLSEDRPVYVELAPWDVVGVRGGTYRVVKGWDYHRQAPRNFRLDGIQRFVCVPSDLRYRDAS